MSFLNHSLEDANKIQAKIIAALTEENIHLTRKLLHCLKECKCHKPKAHSVKGALTTIINKSKFIIMSLSLKETDFSLADISLIDDVTTQPIPSAVFKNIVTASDDSTVAVASVIPAGTTFSKDVLLPDGSTLAAGSPTVADYIKVAGVAGPAGEPPTRPANVVTKANVDYTDSLGESIVGASVVFTTPVQVVAVATADGVSMQLRFGPTQLQFV